jgi:hypothetical protein
MRNRRARQFIVDHARILRPVGATLIVASFLAIGSFVAFVFHDPTADINPAYPGFAFILLFGIGLAMTMLPSMIEMAGPDGALTTFFNRLK